MEGRIPDGSLMFLTEYVSPVIIIFQSADHAEIFLSWLGLQLYEWKGTMYDLSSAMLRRK